MQNFRRTDHTHHTTPHLSTRLSSRLICEMALWTPPFSPTLGPSRLRCMACSSPWISTISAHVAAMTGPSRRADSRDSGQYSPCGIEAVKHCDWPLAAYENDLEPVEALFAYATHDRWPGTPKKPWTMQLRNRRGRPGLSGWKLARLSNSDVSGE